MSKTINTIAGLAFAQPMGGGIGSDVTYAQPMGGGIGS